MTSRLSYKIALLDEETLYTFLIHNSMEYFQENWEDPAYACSSAAPLLQEPPEEFLNEERSRMGSDHECESCASYGCSEGGAVQRKAVKFLRMVREVFGESDGGDGVFDACFILLDKMLHEEIGDEELFNRLHCMFVNESSLVQALLWLGAPNLVWSRTELEERIWGLENFTRECIGDHVRHEIDVCLGLCSAESKESRKPV